jgi:molecular chaperone HscB
MVVCDRCQAPLETPLACGACGALHAVDERATPFDILGLPAAYALDRAELERRLVRFGRLVHPDFFAAAPAEQRARAERNSARLNAAHAVLADDAARADWIVTHLGGPAAGKERDLPRDFLMEVLEWNETLEAAADAPDRLGRLEPLDAELSARRRAALERVAALLTPLPERGAAPLRDARQELDVLRYLDRSLARIEDLRVGRPSHR